jgi:hypothetical protein
MRSLEMFPSVLQVASVATVLALGMPEPSAAATGVPSLQPDEAVVLVREEGRRGGDRGFGGDRGERWRFRGDDGRGFRHFRYGDRDRSRFWFGFGAPYYYGYDYGDCESLRRRGWWRQYRACRFGQ